MGRAQCRAGALCARAAIAYLVFPKTVFLTPSNVKVVSPTCHFFLRTAKTYAFQDFSLFLIKLIKACGFSPNCGRSASRRPPASVFPGFEECRRTPVRLCRRYSLRGSGMRAIKVTSVAAQLHVQQRRCFRSLRVLQVCSTVARPKKTQNASYALLRSTEECCSRPLAN